MWWVRKGLIASERCKAFFSRSLRCTSVHSHTVAQKAQTFSPIGIFKVIALYRREKEAKRDAGCWGSTHLEKRGKSLLTHARKIIRNYASYPHAKHNARKKGPVCENFFVNRLCRCNNERGCEGRGYRRRNYGEKVVVVGRWRRGRYDVHVCQPALIFIPFALVTFYPDVLMNRHRDGRGLDKKKCIAPTHNIICTHAAHKKITHTKRTAAYINPFAAFFYSLSPLHHTRTRSFLGLPVSHWITQRWHRRARVCSCAGWADCGVQKMWFRDGNVDDALVAVTWSRSKQFR